MSAARAFGGLYPRDEALTPLARAWRAANDRVLEFERSAKDATRDLKERRAFAGDPWKYFRDVLGATLTPQQEHCLAVFERETRVLIPSGNNLGKTFIAAGYAIYLFDAVAALPDRERGFDEQGARILLPGPDHNTVQRTIYAEMLEHAARAESRGHLMPGTRSERSVLWFVRPKWEVEVHTPPKKVSEKVAHGASGRHHGNQHAFIEEGQGVEESLWLAAEGMCSSSGNKIISPFNPTEPVGPAFKRSQDGSYVVVHMDAFDHPNVRQRRLVIPHAVDFRVVDNGVRSDCRDRGPYPETPMEPEHNDFAYALLAKHAAEPGPYPDPKVLGAKGCEPRVYRPNASFIAQKRGQWPVNSDTGLFSAEAWSRAVARWLQQPDPQTAPDAVGVDPAREGDDESISAPRWGESAEALLRAHGDALEEGDHAHVEQMLENGRARVGEFHVYAKGDGPTLALALHRRYPDSPLNLDLGSVGSSPYDHLGKVLRHDVTGVSFAASPLEIVHGEPFSENMRTQLYVRAAMAVSRDLVDVPDDGALREELFAHELRRKTRTVERFDTKRQRTIKERVESVALISKDEIKLRIGRSPDRADTFVLSLFAPAMAPPPRDLNPKHWKSAYA